MSKMREKNLISSPLNFLLKKIGGNKLSWKKEKYFNFSSSYILIFLLKVIAQLKLEWHLVLINVKDMKPFFPCLLSYHKFLATDMS